MRVVQNPQKECFVASDIFVLTARVSSLARFFVDDKSGQYYCCDVFEPGFGYLFTDCGGYEVYPFKEKINSTMSMSFRSQQPSLGIHTPLWDFNELKNILDAKCNNTYYKIVDEYAMSGEFDVWLLNDIPW